MTHSIMIMILSKRSLGIMGLSITTLSIRTFTIMMVNISVKNGG